MKSPSNWVNLLIQKSRINCMSEKDAGVRALVRWLWHALVVLFYLFSWGWQIWRHWVTYSWTWYNISSTGTGFSQSFTYRVSVRIKSERMKISSKTWVICILTIWSSTCYILYTKRTLTIIEWNNALRHDGGGHMYIEQINARSTVMLGSLGFL